MATKERSIRSRVREWVQNEIKDETEVSIPTLTASALAHFRGDQAFIQGLMQEMLRPMVYELALAVVQSSRGSLVTLGDTIVTRDEVAKKARTRNVWGTWLEHAGDRHVALLDMTREDLLLAATERQDRGEHELELAKLWRKLADGLEGGQVVRERFSAEEIEKVRAALMKRKRAAA